MKWQATIAVSSLLIVGTATFGGDARALPSGPLLIANTPLLTDFRAFCLETQVQPRAIEGVANRVGAKLTRDFEGATGGRTSYGPMKLWDHIVRGHTIRIGMTVGRRAGTTSQPAMQIVGCSLNDPTDSGASVKEILKWLAFPHDLPKHTPAMYVIHLSNGRAQIINGNKQRASADLASGQSYEMTIEYDDHNTDVSLTRERENPLR